LSGSAIGNQRHQQRKLSHRCCMPHLPRRDGPRVCAAVRLQIARYDNR
jgi:hypothetical protein